MPKLVLLLALMLLTFPQATFSQESLPEATTVDYRPLAFYPDRWEKAKVDFEMLGWEGQELVLVTKQGVYDQAKLGEFLTRLDAAWAHYRDLVGQEPRLYRQVQGKPVICALPKSNLSCGYGCGYVGVTGIEASAFYSKDWPAFQRTPEAFQHYYFYEMGRNYFVFGDRHSVFTTGYAVFMRYVCMDHLGCKDPDIKTRATIEACEEVYANSQVPFFDAFTNFGSGEKNNRLRDAQGRAISPSDQPVMYATAMLKLRKDYGGDEWVKRFYHRIRECRPQKATDVASAKIQCFNWMIAASAAAKQDLAFVFADRWRMPLTDSQRKLMSKVDWADQDISMPQILAELMGE